MDPEMQLYFNFYAPFFAVPVLYFFGDKWQNEVVEVQGLIERDRIKRMTSDLCPKIVYQKWLHLFAYVDPKHLYQK